MGAQIAYFDNAATTFPKPDCVYDFADSFYRQHGGNAGRGNNALASSASELALQTKSNLKNLFECPAKKVVFTASATEALNRVIFGLNLQRGSNVYVTPFEHNAVTRPLNHLACKGRINIISLAFDNETFLPRLDEIENQFKNAIPDLVVMTHASNVFGNIIPVFEIAKIAKKFESTVVVDMSQTAGLVPIDLSTSLVDYAIFAGHKTLYGPFGIGGFICHESAQLAPVLFGGNGINSVEQDMPKEIIQMSEVGSQNIYAIAGLKASTEWILEKGVEVLFEREERTRANLLDLLTTFSNIEVINDRSGTQNIGVVSTLFKSYSPDDIEMILGKFNVAVRGGLHCSPYAHRFARTLPSGTVRFSVGYFTDEKNLSQLEEALTAIKKEGGL